MVVHTLTFPPFYENTYILHDETHEAVIIDPGCLEQSGKEELAKYIADNHLIVKALLHTHCHLDHVFGSAFVKRKYGVKMYMHEKEQVILADVENRCRMYGIKGYEPVEADDFLKEGDTFTFGNSSLEVLFVPGHAPGHLAFVSHADKFVVGGDVLFRGSVGRTDFPFCNHADLMNSIKTKFFTLDDDYTVYAGHNEPTTIGYEKKTNPYVRG